ncbi:hypothetical protein V6Z11_D05G332700 [Gossypium hirsutum]
MEKIPIKGGNEYLVYTSLIKVISKGQGRETHCDHIVNGFGHMGRLELVNLVFSS